MKKIVAIIRPDKLNAVRAALSANDIYLMTVSDVRGIGSEGSRTEVFRGQEYLVELMPKVKLEIAVNDAFVDAAIDAIVQSARSSGTGAAGDGKIFVEPLYDCIRIRSGERGEPAIGPSPEQNLELSPPQ